MEKKVKEEKKEESLNFNPKDTLTKLAIIFGVICFCIITVILTKYFFVDKSYITENYSTDRKLVYLTLEGQEELTSTQKYISDLGYTMRYDTERFKVFKYRNKDVYRFINNEEVLVIVEKAELPKDCYVNSLQNLYNSCVKNIDDTMDEYYFYKNNNVYRILIKVPKTSEYAEGVMVRINYMINNFEIVG